MLIGRPLSKNLNKLLKVRREGYIKREKLIEANGEQSGGDGRRKNERLLQKSCTENFFNLAIMILVKA